MTASIPRILALLLVIGAGSLPAVGESSMPSVAFSLKNGWLSGARQGELILTPGKGAPVDAAIDDGHFMKGNAPEPVISTSPGGAMIAAYETPRGLLVDSWAPFPELGPDAMLRTVTYTNTTSKAQDLLGVTMRINPTRDGEATAWNPRYLWMRPAAPGLTICVGFKAAEDRYNLLTSESGAPYHHVEAQWRLQPGETATVGAQCIWGARGGESVFRDEAQRWYAAIGLTTPANTPAWFYDTILYQSNGGGHIDSRFSDVGGFSKLASQAPYLADIGVDMLWLQAVHSHKTPPSAVEGGWNLYDPRDFSKVDAILGGPEGMRVLANAFTKEDIRLMGEVVPHGGHSVQAMALPEWFTHNRDGAPKRSWGGCDMDYASPPWQQAMKDAVALLKPYGFVGARVDVADGSGSNWISPRGSHASISTLGGPIEMLRAIRDGLASGPELPIVLPEAFDTLEYFGVTPMGYGHDTWMLMGRELPGCIGDPARMATRLRDVFEKERGSLPKGSRILRTLNNHDTVCESGRVDYRYGIGLARALYGVCLMIEGIPMLYQEEELGSFEALRAMNWARRNIPEFSLGDPDYTSVSFAPGVFTSLRRTDTGLALGLANLSGERITGKAELPARLAIPDGTVAYDGVSEKTATITAGVLSWVLAPYETALLRIGQPPLGKAPEQRYPGGAVVDSAPAQPFSHSMDANGLAIKSGVMTASFAQDLGPWTSRSEENGWQIYDSPSGVMRLQKIGDDVAVQLELNESAASRNPELNAQGAARWLVSGRTALLEDMTIRRHFPYPPEADYIWEPTMRWGRHAIESGRMWQSNLEPLHPEVPAVAFIDPTGAALLITDIQTTAENTVATCRGADGQTMAADSLTLRFFGKDPDISDEQATLGSHQPWRLHQVPARQAKPIRVSFTLKSANGLEAARAALAVERLPVDRGEARMTIEGKIVPFQGEGFCFLEPGKVTWTRVHPVTGKYRMRLELRHSETGPDGTDLDKAYTLKIDGRDIPLEWVQRNTWSTGNAWFGYVMTPPMDLGSLVGAVEIAASKPWCFMRGSITLTPVE